MIEITDADVSYAAGLLGCDFDRDQVAFLKQPSSCDVHAGPGSGKTTLLVAKLAILARSWPHRDRGLVVLSHTNVARNEIERRLSRDAAGSRLLGYPHFIGTIQAFVDRFLGLPYLRDVRGGSRTADFVIDNDVFARVAWRKLCMRGTTDLSTARKWLRGKFEHDHGKALVSALSYAGPDCTLVSTAGKLAGPESTSYLELKVLKDEVSSEGIFRFADLFAFGAASVRARPYLVAALRHRFPWVFVDEMQDTEVLQQELLSTLFQVPCVVQKLGDRNQSIFRETHEEDDEPSFAWKGALDLPRSFRLAPRIATFASKLTGVKPQKLIGNSKRKDRAHTVFVFQDETISKVLPAYARLLTTEWPEGFPVDFVAKAVGAKKSTTTSQKRPARISDYWDAFQPDFHAERFPRHSLAAAVHFARSLVTTDRSYHRAHAALMGAVAELLACHEGVRPTRRQLDERMFSGSLDADAVRKLLAALLLKRPPTKVFWQKVVAHCAKLLGAADAPLPATTRAYLGWEEPAALQTSSRRTANVAAFDIDGRVVTIDVSTIHGVKGETHHATLVLETLRNSHDVRTMLPYLIDRASGAPKKRALGHMKRVFVGMTRPQELVCLAVHRAGASDSVLDGLRQVGWSVCFL